MIYLIHNGYRIKCALDILANQVKGPDGYKKFQCLVCKTKGKVGKNDNGNNNVNQGTCFADDNDNQGTFFAVDNDDDDKYNSIFCSGRSQVHGSPSKRRDKLCLLRGCGGVSSVGGRPRGNSLSPIKGGPNLLIDINGRVI